MTAVFLSVMRNKTIVMNKKQTRRVVSEQLCGILTDLADAICELQNKVTLSMQGNTFEIHLEGGSITININEEGGAA